MAVPLDILFVEEYNQNGQDPGKGLIQEEMPLPWVAEICTASEVDQKFAHNQPVHKKTVMYKYSTSRI